MYFVGLVIGSFILPRLGDIYSRKRIALFANILHIAACTLLMISESFAVTIWLNLVIGFGLAGRSFVGYAWMAENVRARDMPTITAKIFMIDGSTLFIATMYFRYINKDWLYIYGVPVILHVFVMFALLNEKDGPKYDYAHGNYDKCRMKLTKIGQDNGILTVTE